MEKIVLIDGHSILNRAFFGIPMLTNSAGLHTNAVFGFLAILFKILEEEKPEYLTVAFDVHAPTFRHDMYEGYKANRKPMAQELREQVPLIKEVLGTMGVTMVEQAGLEADDILGTIAKSSEKAGLEVSLVSGDRDMLQLADEHIKIRIPKTKRSGTEIEDYYAADVKEKYQVTPEEFIEVKALMGDSSDNIPGVPGIGEKTATTLIVNYGSVENIYAHLEEIKNKRAHDSLENNRDLAEMSLKLARIKIDADLDFSLEKSKLENLYTPAAYDKFKELEFKQFLNRFDTADIPTSEERQFVEVSDLESAKKIFDMAMRARMVAFQIKGSAEGNIQEVELAMTKSYSFVVSDTLAADYLIDSLAEVARKVSFAVTADLKSQLRFFPKDAFSREDQSHFKDVNIAAYLINPLKSDYEFTMDEAYEGWPNMEKQLEETGMLELFGTMEMPLVFTLFDMESAGILVKRDELQEYGDQLAVQIKKIEAKIYEEAGEEFNINSPKQLGVILFEKLQMPGGKKTKSGFSTAADVLEKLAPDYPVVDDILEYRQLAKLKSTYADGLANFIQEDGRIRSNFRQTIAATGRLSSTDPNLQNIPIRMEIGRQIRKVFVPGEGFVFIDADYSQIELRVLAHMSGDEHLIDAYKQDQDIHRITASRVFHTPFEEVTELQRRNAKAVNFGIVYGISSYGLSEGLSISPKEAKEYIDKYFETYPKVKEFLDCQIREAKENGYVTTMFGRRRPVPEINASNFVTRSFGERVAMNSPIQGTAADIIKIAMIHVNHRLKKENCRSRLVLQVHDELLIETAKEELEQVRNILKEEMESAAQMSVALEVGIGVGDNWYDAH